jgi:hypothetical protein
MPPIEREAERVRLHVLLASIDSAGMTATAGLQPVLPAVVLTVHYGVQAIMFKKELTYVCRSPGTKAI